MATTSCKAEGKRSLKEMEDDEEEEDDEGGGGGGLGFAVDEKKKKGKKGFSACGSMPPVCCQAESCTADMAEAKRYYRRHKVCPCHAKAPYVIVSGIHQRFCQQCSRFHEVSEFDDTKRSCRRRLAGHNERRRKSSTEYNGEGAKLISN